MEKKSFHLFFCITMSSSIYSNISQNDTKVLNKQWKEMQQRHEEQQQLLVQLKEVAKLHQAEHVV